MDRLPLEVLHLVFDYANPVVLKKFKTIAEKGLAVTVEQYCKDQLSKEFNESTKPDAQSWTAVFCHKVATSCTGCKKSTTRTVEMGPQVPVCARCQKKLPEFRTINKTRAVSEYRVALEDLEGLVSTSVDNPYSRKAPPMKLYLEKDVRRRALAKFGGEVGLAKQKELANERSARYREQCENARARRRVLLVDALAENNLPTATDHPACELYISGRDDKLPDVLKAVKKHHILVHHTKFEGVFSRMLVTEFMGQGSYLSFKRKDEVSERAKHKALYFLYKAMMCNTPDETENCVDCGAPFYLESMPPPEEQAKADVHKKFVFPFGITYPKDSFKEKHKATLMNKEAKELAGVQRRMDIDKILFPLDLSQDLYISVLENRTINKYILDGGSLHKREVLQLTDQVAAEARAARIKKMQSQQAAVNMVEGALKMLSQAAEDAENGNPEASADESTPFSTFILPPPPSASSAVAAQQPVRTALSAQPVQSTLSGQASQPASPVQPMQQIMSFQQPAKPSLSDPLSLVFQSAAATFFASPTPPSALSQANVVFDPMAPPSFSYNAAWSFVDGTETKKEPRKQGRKKRAL
ncbi:hypothetical protein DFS34DRAFT_611852 [Phlyctochytrium arcticum]|nr:hypothetical protein DFS34DRAFT_611852 [Phlyctochytrium arcticum]